MKKIILLLLLIGAAASSVFATDAIYGDLFPYENKHSSFTVDIDVTKMDRMSIQVSYSSETIPDVQFGGVNISSASDTIFALANNIGQGEPVLLATVTTVAPQPLVTGTTYFAVRVSDNLLKLATTYAQAISRDTIDIIGVPIASNTFTLRPVNLNSGVPAYSWLGSNDATNYLTVYAVGGNAVANSTQSLIGATSTIQSRFFDWGEYAYRYLRFKFDGPGNGAIKLRAYINAKLRS